MWNLAARVVQRYQGGRLCIVDWIGHAFTQHSSPNTWLAAVQRVYHHPVFKARCVGFVPLMESLKCLHVKARGEVYPSSEIRRFLVPDDKVDWEVPWTNYNPVDYTAPAVLKQPPWADPPYRDEGELNKLLKFNQLDGDVDRRSYTGKYQVINGFPRNPCGRTGLKGRGLLGRWGPNHAADPIVTRWKKEGRKIVTHNCSGKPFLQFVAICRRDNKEWAIPGLKQLEGKSLLLLANDVCGSGSLENVSAQHRLVLYCESHPQHTVALDNYQAGTWSEGMADPGEKVSATLKREFGEETLDSLSLPEAERQKVKELISSLFQAGEMVYKGYVDDPRNTDNAWMETVAMNFHDETGDSVGKLNLQAGDDAGAVKWMDIEARQRLYASHTHFLQQVAKAKNAHW